MTIQTLMDVPMDDDFFGGAAATATQTSVAVWSYVSADAAATVASYSDPFGDLGYSVSCSEATGTIGAMANTASPPAGRALHQ